MASSRHPRCEQAFRCGRAVGAGQQRIAQPGAVPGVRQHRFARGVALRRRQQLDRAQRRGGVADASGDAQRQPWVGAAPCSRGTAVERDEEVGATRRLHPPDQVQQQRGGFGRQRAARDRRRDQVGAVERIARRDHIARRHARGRRREQRHRRIAAPGRLQHPQPDRP
ncbi:hypothetical protein [Sphingomonas adhaesiva]|uniref:hypothetical protein n=1 Tax=Sphingomonas adhaesiva TaxID=28212 RepID=UPI002FF769B8